jgi:hypothetical protein
LESSREERTEKRKKYGRKSWNGQFGRPLYKWEEIKRTLKIKYIRLWSGMNWFR